MIGYLFVFLYGFFDACTDAFENENFFESIFKTWNQKFWYKRESWKYTRKILGYRFDAWHISKSLKVICFAMAVASAVIWPYKGDWWVIVLNIGIVYNLTFVVVYHGLFKIK